MSFIKTFSTKIHYRFIELNKPDNARKGNGVYMGDKNFQLKNKDIIKLDL